MGKLAGKVALITGGTTGIGYAAAGLFRDEGATVVVTGASAANCAAAAATLGVEAMVSNVADIAAIAALMAAIAARHGRIDVLFANAGTPGALRAITEMDEAEYDRIMGINLKGLFFTVQAVLPVMPDGGAIVLTSSIGSRMGMAPSIVYGATKAGVRSMGRGFAKALVPRNIRVNTLTPGLIDTPLMGKFDIPADEMKANLAKGVPMRRAGQPIEAAAAALFLASADASFITGSEIVVAGGQTDL